MFSTKFIYRIILVVFFNFFFQNVQSCNFTYAIFSSSSVAVSSMIGYVLGIGDRHVHNILIDNFSAEVIHIDLGISFEQGKTLNTPEMVPFRLTRDIEDGNDPLNENTEYLY